MYKIGYISSTIQSLVLTIAFSYTFYFPLLQDTSLKKLFTSGFMALAAHIAVYVFFAIVTAVSEVGHLYGVRIAVLGTSIRYSLFLLFLYRVRRNSRPVYNLPQGARIRSVSRGSADVRFDEVAMKRASVLGHELPVIESVRCASATLYDLAAHSQENTSTF